MKAVFLGDLQCPSASGRQRLWALEQCGVEVSVVDKQHYPSRLGRLAGRTAKILRNPRLLRDCARLEADLLSRCQSIRPDLVWLEWPQEIRLETLDKIRQLASRPFLISFQDDNPWGERHGDRWVWRDYFKLAPAFDLHLVKRPSDVVNLKALGARQSRLWEHGVYRPLFYPPAAAADPGQKIYPVSFIGTCMDQRAELIGKLLAENIPVHVFGTHWEERSDLPQRYPAAFHPAVRAEAYAEVIRQSHICLGLVSHSNMDEWTMRTFEVTGCASLLLAERTPTHEAWFKEGSEAMFFSTPEECAARLAELLKNPARCRAMGQAGHHKCLASNWMIESRMEQLLTETPHLSAGEKHSS